MRHHVAYSLLQDKFPILGDDCDHRFIWLGVSWGRAVFLFSCFSAEGAEKSNGLA